MDLSTLYVFLLGCLAGTVTGIMPGIGPAHLLAILYTWLTGWNPVHLMIFYITYVTVANFIDAVPSLYFGMPGEVSAVPASRESAYLNKQGLTSTALKQAAVGRLFGSLVALLLSVYVVSWLLGHPEIFSSRWQISFYIFTVICIALAGRSAWWQNSVFMLTGLAVSVVGYNYYTQQTYGTFGWSELYSGIPLLPVLIGIYVIPQLLQQSSMAQLKLSRTVPNIENKNYVSSMVRGTGIGYVLGLVPGMSFILGSTAAYTLEKWWQNKYPGKQDPSVAAVVASETASNTGSVSMLIPFLLFGIPIIASEAIIYDLMVDSGAVFTLGSFLKTNYSILVAWFVAACMLGLLMSWPLANWFRLVSQKLLDPRFSWILLGLIMTSLVVEAMHQQKILLYIVVFLPSLIAGWALRKYDVMPFVFVVVLGPNMQSVIYNINQLYF